MVHYKAHNGYEMHRVFNLPPIEFRINQPLKRLLNFSFSRKSMNASKSRQVLFHMTKSISGLYYISRVSISRNVFCRHGRRYTQGFYIQSAPVQQENKGNVRTDRPWWECGFHTCTPGRLPGTQILENNRLCMPTALLPQRHSRNEQTDKPALLLCFLGRHCLGERKPAVAKSLLYRLEQRYRKLAGYDADEPLPSPHYL